jgi:hypothetical protein
MAKAQNLVTTEQITISTTPQIVLYLEQLVSTGLYGKNHAEAAERLVARAVENLLQDKKLRQIQDRK